MSDHMMACGCAADAKDTDGQPVCVVHIHRPEGKQVVATPNLEGRQARCICFKVQPSSIKLAFFKFRGEGSPEAVDTCKLCKYHRQAHEHNPNRVEPRSMVELGKCTGFQSHGAWGYDSYYCGCMGWD